MHFYSPWSTVYPSPQSIYSSAVGLSPLSPHLPFCKTFVNFPFFVETGSCFVAQADLKLLASSDPLASASQSAGITGVSYHVWSVLSFFSSSILHFVV